MTILNRLASSSGRRESLPNQELAQELAQTEDKDAIDVLVQNLSNSDKAIQSDCIKCLYELGYLEPVLIAPYVDQFLHLLRSPNNRLVWGAMIALATIASLEADKIYRRIELVLDTMAKGSVITVDGGIWLLAAVAAARKDYEKRIFPYLLGHLASCRSKSVGQHAERCLVAVNAENRAQFKEVLLRRQPDLSNAQQKRVQKVLTKVDGQ